MLGTLDRGILAKKIAALFPEEDICPEVYRLCHYIAKSLHLYYPMYLGWVHFRAKNLG